MTKILAIQGSDLKKVNIKTDTTILLASEAQKKGYKIYYFEPKNLSFLNGKVIASCKHIRVNENKKLIDWAKIFLDLSKKGLDKRNMLNKSGKNETIYLKHIEEIIKNKKTRAEMLIEQYNKTKKLDFLTNHDENFSYSGF